MPTLCAICRETYGSCAACKRADALPMPEPAYPAGATGMLGESCYTAAQLRAARLDGARAAVEAMGADAARLDFISKRARCDPKMDGQHVWWPTTFNHALRGSTLREAIDAAMEQEKP